MKLQATAAQVSHNGKVMLCPHVHTHVTDGMRYYYLGQSIYVQSILAQRVRFYSKVLPEIGTFNST